jgi:CDP-diacylglycerol--glycerol-3-phosphate 3-phosphatidyltransferase
MSRWNLPNLITAGRLPLAPLAVWCLTYQTPRSYAGAALIALLLELTDIADGVIARRRGMVTDFGRLFDPFSDAFCRFTLFLGLYSIGSAELWMILLIFYRDSSISFFRAIAANRNVVISARRSGKIKAIVQGVGTQIAFLSLGLGTAYPWVSEGAWWSMLAITIVTTWSFVDYFVGSLPILRDAWADRPVE